MFLALMLTTPAVLACAGIEDLAASVQPVPPPPEASRLIGTWEGEGVIFTITADGMLLHETSGAAQTSFNAPVQEWRDDAIVAGIGPIAQTFRISGPRKQKKGVFVLTVNDQDLTRR